MGGEEILARVWLGDTFNHEDILKRKITTIIQVSSTTLAASVCAAFQKSGVELVRFRHDDNELSNLLPVFGDLCSFIDKRIKSKKNMLIWEEGGGAACAVAYVMRARRIGRTEAEKHVREKRLGTIVSERCIEQLNVWQRCGFNVYEMVHGKKTPKRPYVEWIEKESAGQAKPQMDRYCIHS